MGRDRTVMCEGCGASWDTRARFCGRCGRALAVDDGPPPEEPAPGGRRWFAIAGTLVGAAALFVGALVLLGDLSLPRGSGDPAVSLPEAGEVEGQGLEREEREAALAPFDPERISCAPAGCEVWRRTLDVRWARAGPPQWVVGSPVVIEDDHLVGLALETGEDLWRLPIEDELRARPGGTVDLSVGRVMLAGNDERVVLVTAHGVQLVTQAGETRWARSLPTDGAHLLWAHVTGTSVVLAHESPTALDDTQDDEAISLDVTITVLDADDGRPRWAQEGHHRLFLLPALADEDDLLLTATDRAVRALELATGEPRYELPGGPELWPQHAGGFLSLTDPDGRAGTTSLFAATDGTTRAELPGSTRFLLELDGRVIALLDTAGAESGAGSREAVAVDLDGTIVWRHPIERASDDVCCPSILDVDGRWVRISDGPGSAALVVNARSGTVRSDDPLAAAPWEGADVQWQLGPRLLQRQPAEGAAPGYVLLDSSGRSLQISGRGWPGPSTSEPADIILLTTSRELVAVRFP